MKRKREYMTSPFRPSMDDDIRERYFALPEGKRSEALRDAFRLYCGIDHKTVMERVEQPIKRNVTKPLMMGKVKR